MLIGFTVRESAASTTVLPYRMHTHPWGQYITYIAGLCGENSWKIISNNTSRLRSGRSRGRVLFFFKLEIAASEFHPYALGCFLAGHTLPRILAGTFPEGKVSDLLAVFNRTVG